MMKCALWNYCIACLCAAALLGFPVPSQAAEETTPTDSATTETTGALATELVDCSPLPTGELTDAQLKELVPDGSPGRVFIRWRTETQENNYGFNIMRSTKKDGSYVRVNKAIIPGEGTTNIPKSYCYEDKGLPRGAIFYYYIESVSNNGAVEIVEGTQGTQVKVKSVAEEREWLRKKAAGEDSATSSSAAPPSFPKAPPIPPPAQTVPAMPTVKATTTSSPLD